MKHTPKILCKILPNHLKNIILQIHHGCYISGARVGPDGIPEQWLNRMEKVNQELILVWSIIKWTKPQQLTRVEGEKNFSPLLFYSSAFVHF